MNTVIRTYTGKFIDLLNPHPDDIRVEDIAHGLSLLCRFNGQCNFFYSVGEHTLNGMKLTDNEQVQRAWLLHDADEAYLGDMTSPLKSVIKEFREIQENFSNIIYSKFNVLKCKTSVKEIDKKIFDLEKEMVFLDLNPSDPRQVEEKLLTTFKEYGIA